MAPTSQTFSCVKAVTFNMHGFNGNWHYLRKLTEDYDLIFIQEHWLISTQLYYLESVNKDFHVYSKSAMDNKCATGILHGRPFGGVAVMWRTSINNCITRCGFDDDGRVISVKLTFGSSSVIMFGCYFPYDDHGSMYGNSVCNVLGFIESVIELNPGCPVCVTGDFNFECVSNSSGYRATKECFDEYNLVCLDNVETTATGYTYHHESLHQHSWLDHVFTDSSLINNFKNHTILVDPCNLSDHYAVSFEYHVDASVYISQSKVQKESSNSPVIKEYRWDKGDLRSYYDCTGQMLSKIVHKFDCESSSGMCSNKSHCVDIEIYYSEIVHSLVVAADNCIPKIPRKAIKHYWSAVLDDLKQDSIDTYDIWVGAGKPRSGTVFSIMKNAKYRYKLAVKDAVRAFEEKCSDELYDNLLSKDLNNFWKCWKKKQCKNVTKISTIDGKCDDLDIAEVFKSKFSSVIAQCNKSENDTSALSSRLSASQPDCDVVKWLFNVEDVDFAVFSKLKCGKAPGSDSLTPEHVLYSHPSIMVHLKCVFNLMLRHGYVPDDLGKGIIVPLIKDRHGDICNSDNYRAITISSVLSKILEICIHNKFSTFLSSDELQFGFKPGYGCSSALFTFQQVVKYFNSRQSTVYVSAVDASKAFDRINHHTLFSKLMDRQLPICCIKMLANWYSKLYSSVRWNGVIGSYFKVLCGVRQGGILSPILFNIYVDVLISELKNSGIGCHISNVFVGCIMYADDLLILSPSVVGLQYMLDICSGYGRTHDIIFNASKTVCASFGRKPLAACNLFLSGVAVTWVNSLKYLGIVFNANSTMNIDSSYLKRKFYASCNSVLSKSKYASEVVKLQLVKSFCLPYLTYCIGALDISDNIVRQLGVCWNDAFRKIFGYQRWESVKELQYYCGELSFPYLYRLCKWNFIADLKKKNNSCINIITNLNHGDCISVSKGKRRAMVFREFYMSIYL